MEKITLIIDKDKFILTPRGVSGTGPQLSALEKAFDKEGEETTPADPWPLLTIAEALAKAFKGKVISGKPPREHANVVS